MPSHGRLSPSARGPAAPQADQPCDRLSHRWRQPQQRRRAIQEQTFTPVGQSKPIQVDTRFICATNRDLEAEVNAGRFRGDLFYRLGVIPIELAPLRERGDDVLLLARSSIIGLTDLPRQVSQSSSTAPKLGLDLAEISREEAIDSAAHSYLTTLMQKHDGNIAAAAR